MLIDFILQVSDPSVADEESVAALKTASKLGFRFIVDFVSVWALIRLVYFPIYRKRELFFTYFIFNIVIFMICFLLNKVDLSMGAAFGLFAVFSMLRYRTEDISLKDMTYLFLVIAIGLITAVTKVKGVGENIELVFVSLINLAIILVAYLLESSLLLKREHVKTILYERIELINENKMEELKSDLKERTGLNIHRVHIQKIDYLKDAAQIKVFYFE
ncbi:MAG: DUF4956 domain-containing protein [Bacteroidia bacterium]